MGLLINEFTDRDIKSVDRFCTVLKYLNEGRELELDNYTFKIGETFSGGFSLLYKVSVTSGNNPSREEWLGFIPGLAAFTDMVAEMSEDDYNLLIANMTLNKIK